MRSNYLLLAGTIPLSESYALLGEATLTEAFQLAAQALAFATTSAYRAKQLHEALLFVQGTGLEMTIRTYGLEVNADTLREEFALLCEQFKRHGKVPKPVHWSLPGRVYGNGHAAA